MADFLINRAGRLLAVYNFMQQNQVSGLLPHVILGSVHYLWLGGGEIAGDIHFWTDNLGELLKFETGQWGFNMEKLNTQQLSCLCLHRAH